MKKIPPFLIALLLLFAACAPDSAEESSLAEDPSGEGYTSRQDITEEAYIKIEYSGFDATTQWNSAGGVITEPEDIDNIKKALQFAAWEPTEEEAVQTEQNIALTLHQTDGSAREFTLYYESHHEQAVYENVLYQIPDGTYQHVATLLQSYGFQGGDSALDPTDFSETIEMLLHSADLNIYSEEADIRSKSLYYAEEFYHALRLESWALLTDMSSYEEYAFGASVIFTTLNTELCLYRYDKFCLAEISTRLNQYTFRVPSSVFEDVQRLIILESEAPEPDGDAGTLPEK